ncbi:MAG: flavodoxin family protein [Dehalococcoidales bacterium]|nr:flavodoxin family protein [Dehalococcoidales bacterium]
MKILAIVGSPRINGNTNYLVDRALEEAVTHGCEIEKIMLSQYRVNPCLGHQQCASFSVCRQKDDAAWILEKYANADGVILASPVYYYNMTAQMKCFIDRNYFLYTHNINLKALCAGLIVVAGSAGIDDTVGALKRFLSLSGDNSEDRIITVTGYATRIGVVKSNIALVEEARNLGRQMAGILASAYKTEMA